MHVTGDYCLVFTTCNDGSTAEKIATELVTSQTAACVNMINSVKSVYQWENSIETDEEIILVIKTRKSLLDDLEKKLVDIHPYELPELISVPIESGSEKYLNWLAANTK